jgi:hypothetical protein
MAKKDDSPDVAYGLNAGGLANFVREFKETANASDFKAITEIAKRYGLPAGFELYEAVKKLRRAKEIQAVYPYTLAERAGSLERVVYSLALLERALGLVQRTEEDWEKLQTEFWVEAQKTETKLPVDFGTYSVMTALYRAMAVTRSAAITTRESIPNYGKSGGTRPVQKLFSENIHDLFYAIRPTGLLPARGGAFERFCEDVFDFVGLEKRCSGALRYFMENEWPAIQKRLNPDSEDLPETGRNPPKK